MTRRAVGIFATVAALVGASCASAPKGPPEKLYFALELKKNGQLLGHPKLLGEDGKHLIVQRHEPGSDVLDYALDLLPRADGDHFRIDLDIHVPVKGGDAHEQLAMLHGEVRRVRVGELEVELTMMKVNSPEFRALMGLTDEPAPNAI